MVKSKKTTMTIVILSLLLVATLTSTIILAAFSATKTATATITFANGVTLKITGATNNGTDDTLSVSTQANLNWSIKVGSNVNTSGSVDNQVGENSLALSAISIDVTGPTSGNVYVAIKPTVTVSPSGTAPDVDDFVANGWTAVGSTGYYQKTIPTTGGTSTGNAFTSDIVIYTAGTDDPNDFAGKTYTGTLKVKASTTEYTASTVVEGDS